MGLMLQTTVYQYRSEVTGYQKKDTSYQSETIVLQSQGFKELTRQFESTKEIIRLQAHTPS